MRPRLEPERPGRHTALGEHAYVRSSFSYRQASGRRLALSQSSVLICQPSLSWPTDRRCVCVRVWGAHRKSEATLWPGICCPPSPCVCVCACLPWPSAAAGDYQLRIGWLFFSLRPGHDSNGQAHSVATLACPVTRDRGLRPRLRLGSFHRLRDTLKII